MSNFCIFCFCLNRRIFLGVVTPPDEPVPVIANENHHGRSLSQNDLQENFSFDSGFRSASAVPMINYAKNGLPPNFHQNENGKTKICFKIEIE